ncbi:DNA/RNA non-specific endonuclease [Sporosarcina psychrophila]|uniref:DNA/RNA non-specific endonuclease n=1 Tax=Sporosarcina psychrophila TaxID=1476 RepID=UPI0030CE2C92
MQEGVIRFKRKRDDTISQLYEFDETQTTALHPIEQDLQTMNTWLTDMEGLFQAGVKDINFVPSQWNLLTFRSEIRTELFPKVYLNPNDLWVKEHQQLIGTMITTATFQTLEGKKVNTVEENLDENIKYHMYENGLLIKEYVVGQTVFYEVVSKVDYKEEETVKVDKPKENKLLDSFQFGLDLAGLIPVVGEVADGVNGVIYTARGDALNAALSFGAMILVAGWASTGGKLALKGNDLNQVRKVVSTEKMASIYSPIYQDVVNSPLGKTQNQLDLLTNTHYQLGTPNALAFNMQFPKIDIPTSIKVGDVKVEVKNVDVGAKGTGKGIVNEVKEIDFGKHIIKGENGKKQLLPNTKYVTNNNYKYTTDELGSIVNVNAPELVLKKADRNKYAQANVGGKDRLPDDDGGHLIGAQFNGPPDIDNLVPQNSQINRRGGVWYEMETEWANALKEIPPKKVSISIDPIYSNNSMRPDSFMVEYEIEGQFPVIREIANKSGG